MAGGKQAWRGTKRGGEGLRGALKSGCQWTEWRSSWLCREMGTPFPPQHPKTRTGLGHPSCTALHVRAALINTWVGGASADKWLVSGWGWATPGCLHWHQAGALGMGKYMYRQSASPGGSHRERCHNPTSLQCPRGLKDMGVLSQGLPSSSLEPHWLRSRTACLKMHSHQEAGSFAWDPESSLEGSMCGLQHKGFDLALQVTYRAFTCILSEVSHR